jgi:hypothetical protein
MGHASWNLEKRLDSTQADSEGIEAQGGSEALDLFGRGVFELEIDDAAKWNTKRPNSVQRIDICHRLDRVVRKRPTKESKLLLCVLRNELLDHVESTIARQSRVSYMLDIVPRLEPCGQPESTQSMLQHPESQSLDGSDHEVAVSW